MQIANLNQNEAFIEVSNKYSDFLNSFSEKKALVFLEQIDFNKHTIELKGDKQYPIS